MFPSLPVDVSVIGALIRRAKQAHREPDRNGVERALQEATRYVIETQGVLACVAVAKVGIRSGERGLAGRRPCRAYAGHSGWPRDVRGKVRMAASDRAGAAEDFQFVIDNASDDDLEPARIEQRRDWIRRLKLGLPIPDAELLKSEL